MARDLSGQQGHYLGSPTWAMQGHPLLLPIGVSQAPQLRGIPSPFPVWTLELLALVIFHFDWASKLPSEQAECLARHTLICVLNSYWLDTSAMLMCGGQGQASWWECTLDRDHRARQGLAKHKKPGLPTPLVEINGSHKNCVNLFQKQHLQ